MGKRSSKLGYTAWLVTWDWGGGSHAEVEDRIAMILPSRWGSKRVGDIVEQLYALHSYTPKELAELARRPKANPYPARWHNDDCFCGNNPSLHASLVDDLVIKVDPETDLETITWVLPPRYELDEETNMPRQARGPLPKSTQRRITGPLSDREIGRRLASQESASKKKPTKGKRQ